MDVLLLTRTEEKEYPAPATLPPRRPGAGQGFFLQPLIHKSYRRYLGYILGYYLSATMASAFTSLYLIRYLKLPYGWISTAAVIVPGMVVLTNRFWMRMEGMKGFSFVLGATTCLMAGEFLVLSFVGGGTLAVPLLILSAFLSGIGNGGFIVSIFTYRHAIMPGDGKTLYEGWFYFVTGLGALAGPFAGKAFMNWMPSVENTVWRHSDFQLLFLAAALALGLLGCMSLVRRRKSKAHR
jgi:MFS family permease